MNARGPAVLALFLLFHPPSAYSSVRLPSWLGSGMVVQRDKPIFLHGTAGAGEVVSVTQDGRRFTAKAGDDGRWSVQLPSRRPGPMPDIVIESGDRIVLTDLLAGDVWFASGQSNMEFKLRRAAGSDAEIPQATHESIRLFKVGRQIAKEPAVDVPGGWQKCAPDTAADFSAVAYYFARDLQKATGVPVGIICAAWGGTPGEAWLAPEITRDDPDYAALYAEWEEYRQNYPAIKKKYDEEMVAYEKKLAQPRAAGKKPAAKPLSKPHPDENHKYPGVLFDGMVGPLSGLPIKGFLWYQGESNKDRHAQYKKLLSSLVADWRKRWGQGDLPFLIVQLANFKARAAEPSDSGRTRVREAQAQVAREVPACALAVTIDLGESDDIHPLDKENVGRRLALAAQQKVYGNDLVGSGPVHRSVQFRDGKALVEFDSVGGGLVAGKDGTSGAIEGFALAGNDRTWHWAKADVDGGRISVSSDKVPEPVALRYGWADNPPASLYNKEGLPAVPFRTDDWPLMEDASGQDGPPE